MKGKVPVQKRVAVYVFIFLYVSVALVSIIAGIKNGIRDSSPYGIDYILYYNSGKLAASGNAADIFNVPKLQGMMKEEMGTQVPWDLQWFYPPTLLLMLTAVLSRLPFYVSLLLWMVLTLGLAFLAIYLLLPKRKILAFLTLGFPGVMFTFRWGQNSFLSTSFLAFGLYFMQENPVLAGLMFGLLTYKPQLAFFPFLLLLTAREWKTLFWSIIFTLATIGTSILAFGLDVWKAFINNFVFVSPTLMTTIWQKASHIQPTLYTSLRLFGLNEQSAKLLLIPVFIFAWILCTWVWKNTDRVSLKGSVLVLAVFSFLPYFSEYDLMELSIPFVLIAYDFLEYGCRKYEITVLIFMWVTVLLNHFIIIFAHIQICPFVIMANMLMVVMRVKKQKAYESLAAGT